MEDAEESVINLESDRESDKNKQDNQKMENENKFDHIFKSISPHKATRGYHHCLSTYEHR